MCDENQAINNRITNPYVTGAQSLDPPLLKGEEGWSKF